MTIAYVTETTTTGFSTDDGYTDGPGYRDWFSHFTINLPSVSSGDLLLLAAATNQFGNLEGIYVPPDVLPFDGASSSGGPIIQSRLCDGSEPSSISVDNSGRVYGSPSSTNPLANAPFVAVGAVYSGPDTSASEWPVLPYGSAVGANPYPHSSATATFDDGVIRPGSPPTSWFTKNFVERGSFFYAAAYPLYGSIPTASFANATVRANAGIAYDPPPSGGALTYAVRLIFADVLDFAASYTTSNPTPIPVATFTSIGGGSALPGGVSLLNYQPQFFTTDCVLTSDNNPVDYGGSPITFTDTITASSTKTPTGTVEFFDGATSLGTRGLFEVSSGVASASLSITTVDLGVGSHAITAVYDGDEFFEASTCDSLTQVINSPDAVSPNNGEWGYWG